MKTTLDLHDALLKKAKARAARDGTSLTLLIEEGLRLRLREQSTKATSPVRLPCARTTPTSSRSIGVSGSCSPSDSLSYPKARP
jgi:hypothetical protein